jgi:hypothetical protein
VNPSSQVKFELVRRETLSRAQTGEMFELLARHFEGVRAEHFQRDLAEKSLAALLYRDEKLVGFSTLLSYTTKFENEAVNVIYSGDTIVAPEAWGTTALPRAWVASVERLRAEFPPGRCFWLLLTSGFRTYRFLPVFWREFFPRFDCVTAPAPQRLLAFLARRQFGHQFDSNTGIVRFGAPQRLGQALGQIPQGREADPHIAFFLSTNPGWARGDELVCLTELTGENLTAAGRRMMPQACALDRAAR